MLCKIIYSLLLLLSSFLIVYFTYKSASIARKRMKEELPIIADVAYKGKNKIKIVVTNNKPYNITIKDIELKKKKGSKFFKEESKWETSKSSVSTSPIAGMSYKNIQHFVIKDQEDFYIIVPKLEEKAFYKICVKTTGGSCSHTSTLPVSPQDKITYEL